MPRFAFTIFWLYVLDRILTFTSYQMIWRLSPTPQLIGDLIVFVMCMGLLLGSLMMTRNNYRAIKQTFFEP
jgi:hypothetical protein